MTEKNTRTIVDGCTAAAHIAYALSEVATIYPITPVASMGETAMKWQTEGRNNIFGKPMAIAEMESELGAAGATHGALSGGALATTFTASQGLLLMIPNMYKIAGELLPAVFHVGCRSVATHALSIFGDHSDVMACRQTGFAMLMSDSVQAAADLALVAHLSAIEGSVPVLHMFDGWRTSNEMSTVELPAYEDIAPLVNHEAVARFRSRAMDPDAPTIRGTAQNPDVYFQNREAANRLYAAFPAVVKSQMAKVAALTGRSYRPVEYFGAPDADRVIVIMGSAAKVAEETAAFLNRSGAKTGVINVRLYRPFPVEDFLAALPKTVRYVAAMDRTKEPGSAGEPLYLDVAAALLTGGRAGVVLTGGRYGLGSKDFSPAMCKSVFDAMPSLPAGRKFTVGITDDVTALSLPVGPSIQSAPESMKSFLFYGMGSDGTVGATRQAAGIISALTGDYVQAFFDYSAKKSGGYTVSSLRVDSAPINCEYAIEQADYIGVNRDTYARMFDLAPTVAPGATIVVNSALSPDDLFPAELKRTIVRQKARVYVINGAEIALKNGLGVRVNTIMETIFLHLCGMVDFNAAVGQLKDSVKAAYAHEGEEMVKNNLAAIDAAVAALAEFAVPQVWATAVDAPEALPADMPEFVRKIAEPCLHRRGDSLPVSALTPDGIVPVGESRWEKRTVALKVPVWDSTKCIQCTFCSLVCSHAAIRPYLLDKSDLPTVPAKGIEGKLWRIQVSPRDCTGCGSCATICPVGALTMTPLADVLTREEAAYKSVSALPPTPNPLPRFNMRGSQLEQPLLEFSGACGGCGETPYVKLLTQLFGERMVIANATGCSSIWGADYPSMPYCANAEGKGPAWGNSLFEDNAEYAMGIALALRQRDKEASVWAIGGDGWAYDIGFGGLDHLLSRNLNINILVMDTECYSNTGGQMSKATPLGCVAKYAPDGKRTVKKDLGRMAVTYGHVYVGQISLAANPTQAIEVLKEAEAYQGPSLVIAYCPCINHGIRAGMSHSATEMRAAVKAGYWPLWRYNPEASPALKVDSAAPDGSLDAFLDAESRYADLARTNPDASKQLRTELAERLTKVYNDIKDL